MRNFFSVCVCCECLCCCYCLCSCALRSCWHIDSGIRKNACTTRIHSETRYSHGALTGELDQIEVLPLPFSLSFLHFLHTSLLFASRCQQKSRQEWAGVLDVRPLDDEVVEGLYSSSSIEFSVVFGFTLHMFNLNYLLFKLEL